VSLKSVHILFIVLATALTVMFGVWSLRGYSTVAAGVSFLIAAGLIVYGVWFVGKTKGMDGDRE
jgi:lipopolysaccharide export LptBFGC system permease protein LptF